LILNYLSGFTLSFFTVTASFGRSKITSYLPLFFSRSIRLFLSGDSLGLSSSEGAATLVFSGSTVAGLKLTLSTSVSLDLITKLDLIGSLSVYNSESCTSTFFSLMTSATDTFSSFYSTLGSGFNSLGCYFLAVLRMPFPSNTYRWVLIPGSLGFYSIY